MNRRQADRLCEQIARRGKAVALARPRVVCHYPEGRAATCEVWAVDVASGGFFVVPPGVTTWRELRLRLIAESEVRAE